MFVLSDFKYKGMSEVRVSESRLALVLTLTHTKPRPPPSLKPSQPLWAADRRAHEYLCKTFLGGTSLGVEKKSGSVRYPSNVLNEFLLLCKFTKPKTTVITFLPLLFYCIYFSQEALFLLKQNQKIITTIVITHTKKKITQAQEPSTEPEPSGGLRNWRHRWPRPLHPTKRTAAVEPNSKRFGKDSTSANNFLFSFLFLSQSQSWGAKTNSRCLK